MVSTKGIHLGDVYSVSILPSCLFSVPHPFFSSPKLETFANRASKMPLLGLFGAFVHDWIPLIDEYYYCMCNLSFCKLVVLTPFLDTSP